MYSEVYKSKKSSFVFILLFVTAAFCLLSLPTWFNWGQFSGIYEIVVLLAASFAILSFIRHRFYEYTYILNEDIITVRLKLGSKDTVICQLPLSNIIDVCENCDLSSLKKKHEIKNVMRCNGDMFGNKGLNIVYIDPERTVPSVLIFMPSEKFTEILQSKRIDNHSKV